jgi:elongation factor G
MASTINGVRAIALAGPAGAGKTSLAEALLYASGAISRQGTVEAGTSVGDASPEARARRGSTELNLMRFDYLGDGFALLDAPGSVSFAADAQAALAQADMALVVVDPDPARAALAEPALRQIEALGLPHAIFVNKIDAAKGRIRDLLEALQPLSAAPLIARQIPIREGHSITGFVDLALERAFHYVPGKPSEPIAIPNDLAEREANERFHMLETLADHDDILLEQLLLDEVPDLKTIFADLVNETRAGLVVPVMFGSALNSFGIRRLLKFLRHEAPTPLQTAERIGLNATNARIFKIANGGAVGRLALARVLGDGLDEGSELTANSGEAVRVGTLFSVQGEKTTKLSRALGGDIIAIAKADNAKPGMLLGRRAHKDKSSALITLPPRNAAITIATRDRKDDVRLSTALHKLVEEDPGLDWGHDELSHATLLRGINDEHLSVTIAKLKRRYGVDVDVSTPRVAHKESIRGSVTQRGRHKKQSGGHGQYGDVVIELRPLPRGEGFKFDDHITGGAIPKQWIPAVEQGVRDAMEKGPLGFPVVDVAVTLVDGSFHSVDSSELAFRIAGRIAMAEALTHCSSYLLEPISLITIDTPSGATSRASSVISSRRGQILGIGSHPDWPRWDRVEATIPEVGLAGLDAELRSLSQGLASFTAHYDHVAELSGRLADEVVKAAAA